MAGFFVENFGCRATQADGAAIERQLIQKGLTRAITPEAAQVVILNTCTVTASADQDVRNSIRRIHRQNPDCKILVTGCYAQRAPEELSTIPGVSWVVGNSHKHAIAEVACGSSSGFVPLTSLDLDAARPRAAVAEVFISDIFAHTELLAAPVFDADTASEKTRPNLKVQDGCNNRCSFCIIPSVRGRSRSLQIEDVIREVRGLVANGYREVVISGINLGRWGRDFEGAYESRNGVEAARPRSASAKLRFAHLIRQILGHTELQKLRISSVEPMDWSDELISLVATSSRIAKHAHVPMQSGSDRILRLMHRKYRPWHYADRIRKIRRAMPDAAIGADVMVGFPGETDADFEETRQFIDSLPMTYLHVFTFSARPGTPAAAMPGQVHPQVMKERNRILRDLAARKKREFQETFIGRELQAITLTNFNGTHTECLTDNYQKLWLEGRWEGNQWVRARIEDLGVDAVVGIASSGMRTR
ncbi:MAG TPA: tRNA (N(6)-L-threonylcarbamoyladenosine(37)-C(2))-methylthiotransferase MtaB [Terriglobales bacterium]|nr:tRNA (N(6)-L-threonylcarbamoyladenosine(37)-C(2))-methylthiotransferase MtaB [Terriglobales bacterium]